MAGEVERRAVSDRIAALRTLESASCMRSAVRRDHLIALKTFAAAALRELPTQASRLEPLSEPVLDLLHCACDVAKIMQWLGAPDADKLCHNLSIRSHKLRQHAVAAGMSAFVVQSCQTVTTSSREPRASPPPPATDSGELCSLPTVGGAETTL